MIKVLFSLATICTLLASWLALAVHQEFGERVDIGDRKLRVRVRGEAEPTVVLENFGAAPLEGWIRVQPEVAKFARVLAYDHACYWGSDPGPKPRDAMQVTDDLHALLQSMHLSPPYVFVGYSFGGPFVRVFAHRFPNEVAGLVLVDPSQEEAFDWLREHHPHINRITEAEAIAKDEWATSWTSLSQARKAMPLPNVPVTLITCLGGYEKGPIMREMLPIWLNAHRNWLKDIPNSRHIVAEDCTHGIVIQKPQVVIDAIREMVEQVRAKHN